MPQCFVVYAFIVTFTKPHLAKLPKIVKYVFLTNEYTQKTCSKIVVLYFALLRWDKYKQKSNMCIAAHSTIIHMRILRSRDFHKKI